MLQPRLIVLSVSISLPLLLTVGCTDATTPVADAQAEAEQTAEVSEPEAPAPEAAPATDWKQCRYVNAFSQGEECKRYVGDAWTPELAAEDCADAQGTLTPHSCDYEAELGRCALGEAGLETELVFPGDDSGACALTQTGCEVFGGGSFTAAAVCGDEDPGPAPPTFGSTFTQPELQCVVPDDSDEEVCTWNLISGCTEEGRRFDEFGQCSAVYTQRPYFPYEVEVQTAEDDPRLSDPEYLEQSAWVKEQVESCACVCCHSDSAPSGASGWHIDAGPLWLDTLDDDGLAMMAGLVDSTAFGAFDPANNNGFDRSTTGVPTTDISRMQDFLIDEYLRRGNTVDDSEEIAPFGGPLYSQLVYEPSACDGGEGVDAEGRLTWAGGAARYVYVLSAEAATPGVPPNLDEPDGTLWLVDVATESAPIDGPIAFGQVPTGARQRIPEQGAPESLESGRDYYLYVLYDIGIPLTRCLFTVP